MNFNLAKLQHCKQTHIFVRQHFEHMIQMCEEFAAEPYSQNYESMDEEELLSLKEFKAQCIKDKLHMEKQIEKLDKMIYENCQHQFVYDTIDVDPEKTQHIKYCELCEMTVDPFVLPSSTETQLEAGVEPLIEKSSNKKKKHVF